MLQASGGCLCGAVRYRLDGEPSTIAVCHCKTCQKNTGSAFSTNLVLPEGAVELTGNSPAIYEERASADSPPFYRSFCSRCGSPISGKGSAYPGIVFIKVGTLDDPSWVKPTVQMWCAEKQPWVPLGDGIQQLPAGPGS